MAAPTVNAAPDTEITVKANGTTTKATLQWSKSMPRERTAQFQHAQAMLDSEVMRVLEPYMSLDTGVMIASMQSSTHPGSGEIHVNTPYAAKVNYVSGIMGKNGPNRGRRFFDRMKADKLSYFKAFVAKALGAKSK